MLLLPPPQATMRLAFKRKPPCCHHTRLHTPCPLRRTQSPLSYRRSCPGTSHPWPPLHMHRTTRSRRTQPPRIPSPRSIPPGLRVATSRAIDIAMTAAVRVRSRHITLRLSRHHDRVTISSTKECHHRYLPRPPSRTRTRQMPVES